ncbi:TIM44-like domain-containing protein [Azorhizobium sp. AG788]|uniref:Tim44 domain-containing protein n=1 Tax=Azorhizobium sp. AG788 TaxID=2183897 RepID=UPI00313885A7
MSVFKRLSGFVAVVALGAAMTLPVLDAADARQGGSMGSRGSRTYQAPSSTTTAPNASAPIQRSTTPYNQQGAASTAAASRGGLFGGGFAGNLMRGLLIGGLVGMLFGGGLGGLSGFLGLLLQAALLAGVVMLAMRFFANRRQPAPAGAPMARDNQGGMFGGGAPNGSSGNGSSGLGGMGGLGGGLGGALGGLGGGRGPAPVNAPPRVKDELGIKPADFDAFEKTLSDVQAAFSREDRSALANLVTPEVLGYLEEELRANAERGLRNQVSDVKLLQGDLSEAWREGALEYATVAMRYEARDTLRDRTTGALAPGSSDAPSQSVELWTFIRPRGAPWKLSAIQEA